MNRGVLFCCSQVPPHLNSIDTTDSLWIQNKILPVQFFQIMMDLEILWHCTGNNIRTMQETFLPSSDFYATVAIFVII